MKDFVRFWRQPPDSLTLEHIHQYLFHLTQERRVSFSAFNIRVAAIRFFYNITLQKEWKMERIPFQKQRRRLPVVLSQEEVQAVLDAAACLRDRAILSTTYATGMRSQEVAQLQVSDLDGQRGTVLVRDGKGRKDRYTIFSKRLQTLLREYWRQRRPEKWLFPSTVRPAPLTSASVARTFRKAKDRAGVNKPVSVHSLRPLLCHPPAGGQGGHPSHPGPAGSQESVDHTDLPQGSPDVSA